MRKLAAALVLLGGLLLAGDHGARLLAQRALAVELAGALELRQGPEVRIGGFPFVPGLLSGSVDAVEVEAGTVRAGSLRLRRVRLLLRDVRFEPSRVLSGRLAAVRTGGGRGSALLPLAELEDALADAGFDVGLRVREGSLVGSTAGGEIAVRPAMEGSTLALAGVPGAPGVPLPSLGGTVVYRGLEVTKEGVRLGLRIRRGPLRRPG